MNLKGIVRKKFIYALVVFVGVTLFWAYMKYDAIYYRDLVLGLSGMFLVSQAYVDVKKPEGGE